MNKLTLFNFDEALVRVISKEPLEVVAQDVCRALDIQNWNDTLSAFSPEEKGTRLLETSGGTQEVLTVTEPGLYRLIFRSDKPVARRFQDWVFREVLPAIRKSGGYAVNGFDLAEAYRTARTGSAQVAVLKLMERQLGEASAKPPGVAGATQPDGALAALFWAEVVKAFEAGVFGTSREEVNRYFRLIPTGGRRLFFEYHSVLKALNEGAGEEFDAADLRMALAVQPYWLRGEHRQRFGAGEVRRCWGVDLALVAERDVSVKNLQKLVELVAQVEGGQQ